MVDVVAAGRTRRGGPVRFLGALALVASGLGFPLTQLAIARGGRRGALAVEGVTAGLLVRDAALVRLGAPARLRALPRTLLWLELGAAGLATLTGLAAVARPVQAVGQGPAGRLEALRRFAVGLLFGLHTWRFRIFLAPGRGLKALGGTTGADDGG
jgi:hypothetical protein